MPIRSVLVDRPGVAPQPLSKGTILNQLGEFEIVYEGPGSATGNLNLTSPFFCELQCVWVLQQAADGCSQSSLFSAAPCKETLQHDKGLTVEL